MSDEGIDPVWRPLADRFARVLGCDVDHGMGDSIPAVWIVGPRRHAPRGLVGCAFGDERLHVWLDAGGATRAARFRAEEAVFLTPDGWGHRATVKVGADDLAAADCATLCRLDAAVDGLLLAALAREGEAQVVAAMARAPR